MLRRFILFLVLNFAALAIGSLFTSPNVQSEWYLMLNKAPWTPPGWVFGFAWTSIMILFAIYMAKITENTPARNQIILLYFLQWVLNVSWNPLFFKFHLCYAALFVLIALSALLFLFLFRYRGISAIYSLAALPYLLWLLLATSLNAYAAIMN